MSMDTAHVLYINEPVLHYEWHLWCDISKRVIIFYGHQYKQVLSHLSHVSNNNNSAF